MKSILIDIVKSNEIYVKIDTRFTFDHGWKTMVFECNENGTIKDLIEMDKDMYISKEDANIGHLNMINKWKERK